MSKRAPQLIAAARPTALVIALGLDAPQDDPISVLNVMEAGFAAAAGRIAGARLPTAIIRECGRLCEAPPPNRVAFLGAFDCALR